MALKLFFVRRTRKKIVDYRSALNGPVVVIFRNEVMYLGSVVNEGRSPFVLHLDLGMLCSAV